MENMNWDGIARAMQVIQFFVSLAAILYVSRAYRATRKDAEYLINSHEAAFDGSRLAAANNIARERLLLFTHITLFTFIAVVSFLIPLAMTGVRIFVMRFAVVVASLLLLRVSHTSWVTRIRIIEQLRATRARQRIS